MQKLVANAPRLSNGAINKNTEYYRTNGVELERLDNAIYTKIKDIEDTDLAWNNYVKDYAYMRKEGIERMINNTLSTKVESNIHLDIS